MYCDFFGFAEKPFDVTPDPKYLYLSPNHEEILASLVYGIQERRGFITIVGEVGTGKTTLLNAVLERFDQSTQVAFIFNTGMTFEQMLNSVLFDFGLTKPGESLSKVEAIQRLNDFAIQQLAGGGNVVLIIDEAQNLDSGSMENLRLLSNLETHKHKLIQIILSGQPELVAKLNQHELRQLAQRISLKRYVLPLSEKETYEYIQYRLSIADFKSSELFDRRAQKLIWEYSQGIPRKINILCDNALLIGYVEEQKRISAGVVEEAIKDLSWSPFGESHQLSAAISIEERSSQTKKKLPQRWIAMAAGLVFAVCLIFAVGLYLGHSGLILRRDASVVSNDGLQADITSQTESSEDISDTVRQVAPVQTQTNWANEIASAAEGKTESADTSAGEPISHHLEPVAMSPEATKKKTAFDPPLVPEEPDKALMSQPQVVAVERVVVVEKGDTLGTLIEEAYETYNEKILRSVLQQNPEIRNPDRISVGQIIRLPQIVDQP